MEKDEKTVEEAPVRVEPEKASDAQQKEALWRKVGIGLAIAAVVGFALFLSKGRSIGTD